jgi:hypothetical protein
MRKPKHLKSSQLSQKHTPASKEDGAKYYEHLANSLSKMLSADFAKHQKHFHELGDLSLELNRFFRNNF